MTKEFETIVKLDPKLNIMREFKLEEISLVDKPAQKHATAAIIKRDGDLIEEAREAAQVERERIVSALENQKTAAGRNLEALGDVLQRAQSANFQMASDPMPELVDFIRVLNQDIITLGEEERRRSEQRANATRITTKSEPSLIRKAAQIEALADRLAKSNAASCEDALELKKLANDTCSELMATFDSVDAALTNEDVVRLYEISTMLDGLAARSTP